MDDVTLLEIKDMETWMVDVENGQGQSTIKTLALGYCRDGASAVE